MRRAAFTGEPPAPIGRAWASDPADGRPRECPMGGIAMAEAFCWQAHEVGAAECRRALFRMGWFHSVSQRSICSLPGRNPLGMPTKKASSPFEDPNITVRVNM